MKSGRTIATESLAALFALMLFAACGVMPRAQAGGGPCGPVNFAGNNYTVCKFHAPHNRMKLYWRNGDGEPYGSFDALRRHLEDNGELLSFAMNAGMYNDKLAPIGLYVEQGKRLKSANSKDGPGNFHLKPNGVFFLAGGKARITETGKFLKLGIKPRLASQSGPMLVIDGRLHPRFDAKSTSRKRRNGVGVKNGGDTVVFAISDDFVTFHEFASLFLSRFGTPNALFFDGTVSSLFSADLNRSDWGRPMGPIVAVTVEEK